MAYTQLVSPNLNAAGSVDYCEQFAERVWKTGVTRPTAIAGWNAIPTQYRHTGEPPSDVSVQLYWTYEQDGHTATSVPGKGILSSPWKLTTTQAWLINRAQLEQIYSDNGEFPLGYLGWSEYFNGTLVAQENDMALTPGDIDKAIKGILGRQPTAEELANQDYANNPALLIETLWNNGGEARFNSPQSDGNYVAYSGPQLFTKS